MGRVTSRRKAAPHTFYLYVHKDPSTTVSKIQVLVLHLTY